MNPNDVISSLPRIGEKRMEIPTIMDGIETAGPQKCVVVEVSVRACGIGCGSIIPDGVSVTRFRI